jgi:hypothetical protein
MTNGKFLHIGLLVCSLCRLRSLKVGPPPPVTLRKNQSTDPDLVGLGTFINPVGSESRIIRPFPKTVSDF